MYCVAYAVAELTGWTRDQVWLHVRWLREQNGKRLTDHPYGGIATYEARNALIRAGYEPEVVFTNRRMRLRDFVREYGKSGNYFLKQNGHVFAFCSGNPDHQAMAKKYPRAVIVAAYRIVPKAR